MSPTLLDAQASVVAPVAPSPAVIPQEKGARSGLSGSHRLVRTLVRASGMAVLLVALTLQIVAPVDTAPSLELRRILVILLTLAGWIVCSWRGLQHDYARTTTPGRF
jgi:hypothetical protein